jgi:hypothetical protein
MNELRVGKLYRSKRYTWRFNLNELAMCINITRNIKHYNIMTTYTMLCSNGYVELMDASPDVFSEVERC